MESDSKVRMNGHPNHNVSHNSINVIRHLDNFGLVVKYLEKLPIFFMKLLFIQIPNISLKLHVYNDLL